ncbi:CRP/FNR family transcriptional regulator [Thiogranum longum]|uniref:CRP/FNR family transcriptional regulator n=1 Tax=Thiogranum longum TaxID=1537524 RepID=A0A4R1HFY4_9GAMM|nr:Crp/Fnr family transcriptional regulator [Thiogranum longum]TCK18209.1 CRP/FNR family transcriptional regulator [Thiogranum longum]
MRETEGCAFPNRNKPATLQCELTGFAAIDGEVWREALSVSEVISCPAGTKLVECGSSADKFVIVLQGVVKVYEACENGREISLYRVCSGQVCVLTLTRLLLRSNQCAQAVAEQDVRLLAMPPEYFERLLAESKGFRSYLMTSMAHCITDVVQLTAQVSFRHLDLRLVQLIRKLSTQEPDSRIRCTHQTIANELGTTREVVSRLLKELERSGHIKLSRGSIQVLDSEKLEDLCLG